jgi:hypothetical protein
MEHLHSNGTNQGSESANATLNSMRPHPAWGAYEGKEGGLLEV